MSGHIIPSPDPEPFTVPDRASRSEPERVPCELLHIDLVRFVASVGIVLAHSLEFFFVGSSRRWVHDHGGGVSLFVDVFFVISGFIITHVYAERVNSFREFGVFMQRRFGRLLPLHWLMLAAFTAFLVIVQQHGMTMRHPVAINPGCIITGAFLIQTLVDCGSEVPNGVSWSISAEMVMYVCFPLFLCASHRRPALLFIGAVITLVAALVNYHGASGWISHGSVLRALPAFLWGMALSGLRDRMAALPFARTGLMIGLATLIIGGLTGAPMWAMLFLAYSIPALAIAADMRRKASAAVRRIAPLGQLTYSMYMIHPLVITVLMNALGDKLLHLSGIPMMMLGMGTYGIILVISIVSFQYLETPGRRWIDSLPLFRRRRAIVTSKVQG